MEIWSSCDIFIIEIENGIEAYFFHQESKEFATL
jgi:hypothetical protein